MLAAKAETFELFSAQARPHSNFSIRRREAQFARERHAYA